MVNSGENMRDCGENFVSAPASYDEFGSRPSSEGLRVRISPGETIFKIAESGSYTRAGEATGRFAPDFS
jgi:hypothetical protein